MSLLLWHIVEDICDLLDAESLLRNVAPDFDLSPMGEHVLLHSVLFNMISVNGETSVCGCGCGQSVLAKFLLTGLSFH